MGRRLRPEDPTPPETVSIWQAMGYIIMLPFLPIILVAMLAKALFSEGYGLHFFIGALIFLAIFSGIKPPFY